MSWSRRDFLALGVLFAVPALVACGSDGASGDGLPQYEYDGPQGPESLFSHGVASGDPLTDAVILWTRVTPDANAGTQDVEVFVEVSKTPGFNRRVAAAYYTASADNDHTLKVDLAELEPGTTYYYRFQSLGRISPIGRTRTAPDGPVASLRFAQCSCSNFAHGYFYVYRHIAQRADLDAVIHLGDYIYEYGDGEYGEVRPCDPPGEIITLEDYRRRYAQYRGDADLQEVHRQNPFIVVWDDHEATDNGWSGGASNHTEGTEGTWADRKVASKRAYFEWLPIREVVQGEIYRRLRYGDLLELFMLDTRIAGREEQLSAGDPELTNPQRQLLGAAQESWLLAALSDSTAQWKVLGQQVVFGQYLGFTNTDAWDGYPAARERVLEHVRQEALKDVVVLTGDIHSSWAMDVASDPFDSNAYDPATGMGGLAVEFVTPAVSSPGFPAALQNTVPQAALANNPHMRYVEVKSRGYVLLDFTPERALAAWYYIEDPEVQGGEALSFATAWATVAGKSNLRSADEPAPRGDAPQLAP